MSLKPIPKRVLIDTAVLNPLIQGSRSKTYGPDQTLNNVLIQSKTIRQYNNGSWISVAGAMMFWDNTYSTAATFNLGDKITYIDKMTGQSVSRYITDGLPAQTDEGLHHLELTLI